MALPTKPFDVAQHLETDEDIRLFLQAAFEEDSEEEFIHALNTAVRAKGMTEIARKSGLTRASLYKSLADGGKPRFDTIVKVTKALGCKLVIACMVPRKQRNSPRISPSSAPTGANDQCQDQRRGHDERPEQAKRIHPGIVGDAGQNGWGHAEGKT